MPYRIASVESPDGGTEIFQTRISEEDLGDWLAIRPDLRELGMPDRPWDIAAGDTKTWLPLEGWKQLSTYGSPSPSHRAPATRFRVFDTGR